MISHGYLVSPSLSSSFSWDYPMEELRWSFLQLYNVSLCGSVSRDLMNSQKKIAMRKNRCDQIRSSNSHVIDFGEDDPRGCPRFLQRRFWVFDAINGHHTRKFRWEKMEQGKNTLQLPEKYWECHGQERSKCSWIQSGP